MQDIIKKLLGEFVGTIFFLATMTGAGIQADAIAEGNTAITLIGQSLGCAVSLYVLINIFGPISGAHFNPCVSILFWEDLNYNYLYIAAYIVTQIAGSCVGVLFAHVMYDLPVFEYSVKRRTGMYLCYSEVVATWVLLATIYTFRKSDAKNNENRGPHMVGLLVFAGIWSFSSTFFCNPAVTIARCITNTFIGIAPRDVWPFIVAQIIALIVAMVMFRTPRRSNKDGSYSLTPDSRESSATQRV